MNRFIQKAGKALSLGLSDPYALLTAVKPYLFQPKSGRILLNSVAFDIELDLDPVMRAMYFGAYQMHVASFMKKHLKKGDIFIDVGANVGYISAYAMGLIGQTGQVHAFEPVTEYFERLKNVQKNNPDYRLYINKVALGEREGISTIAVTNVRNIGWNTMVPGFMSEDTIKEEIEIPVTTLDSYLSSNEIDRVRLVKIDVEGFEFPVIKGFQKYLREAKELPILLVEVAPIAYHKLDASIDEFTNFMSDLGYVAVSLDLKHEIEVSALKETTDVVFMPKYTAQ
ncbi:MAG: FkbM family methyltransferase [Gloeotrichia echinulata IR180]